MVDYKLRLGDGTTFSVDEKGLTTWLQGGLVDDKARVQPAGSKKWFSLKQVLAAQGTQRGHAVRQTVKGRADVDRQAAEETAEIERKVAEQRATEERKAAEDERKAAADLAAAERKAAADRTAAERALIEEREAAARRAVEERAAAEARAAAERQAEQERLEAERRAAEEAAEAGRLAAEAARLAAEERAAAERREAEAREAERVAEAEMLVAAERAERAEKKRKAEEARLEAEQRAAEDARLAAERKAAEERAAERKAAEDRAAAAAAARREAEAREAEAREAERVAEAERLVAAERAERAEKKRKAEEAARLEEKRAADDRLAAERRAADARLATRAAEERAARERERDAAVEALGASDPAEPPATEIPIEPAATMVKVEDFERELGLVPVMFNDGTEPGTGRDSAASRARATPPSVDRPESDFATDGEKAPRAFVKPPTAVDTAVLRLLKVIDRGVVWVVRTLAPLVGDAVVRSVGALKNAGPKLMSAVPKLKGAFARRATPAEPASSDEMPAAVPAVVPAPWAAPAPVPAPWAAPAPAVPTPRAAPAPAPPPWAAPPQPPPPKPASVKSAKTEVAPQRQAAVPPPSFQKMEVIPFAAAPTEPKGDDDVWDGEDPWQEPSAVSSMFAVVWLWVKRVTIATALIVTVALLALNKEKWLPQAKDAAIVLGEGVDKLSERVRTVPPEAIEAARAQIPYLRPQTIELIMARSSGVMEPAEVFRRAHQAVESARPSLPSYVGAEIDNLTNAAAAGLDPAESGQLRGYLAALRAGTPSAAYQDKEAVWLMARGARRLPAERLARMEELFAQAVTMAMPPPSP